MDMALFRCIGGHSNVVYDDIVMTKSRTIWLSSLVKLFGGKGGGQRKECGKDEQPLY
jgi:hypothetical protein